MNVEKKRNGAKECSETVKGPEKVKMERVQN